MCMVLFHTVALCMVFIHTKGYILKKASLSSGGVCVQMETQLEVKGKNDKELYELEL